MSIWNWILSWFLTKPTASIKKTPSYDIESITIHHNDSECDTEPLLM